MGLTKQQKRKNALIQKEQLQLLKIQKELENVLLKVNDTINVLKVEELQLKSSSAVFDTVSNLKQEKVNQATLNMPSVSNQAILAEQANSTKILEVNQQEMNLDIITQVQECEEEDDDDE